MIVLKHPPFFCSNIAFWMFSAAAFFRTWGACLWRSEVLRLDELSLKLSLPLLFKLVIEFPKASSFSSDVLLDDSFFGRGASVSFCFFKVNKGFSVAFAFKLEFRMLFSSFNCFPLKSPALGLFKALRGLGPIIIFLDLFCFIIFKRKKGFFTEWDWVCSSRRSPAWRFIAWKGIIQWCKDWAYWQWYFN